jgi:hypothetical protein
MTYLTLSSAFSARLVRFFGFQGGNSDIAEIISQISTLERPAAEALCWEEEILLSPDQAWELAEKFDLNVDLLRSLANRASEEGLAQACLAVDDLYHQLFAEGLYQPRELALELLVETGASGLAPEMYSDSPLIEATTGLVGRLLQALDRFAPLSPETLALICGCPGTEPVFKLQEIVNLIANQLELSAPVINFDSESNHLSLNLDFEDQETVSNY